MKFRDVSMTILTTFSGICGKQDILGRYIKILGKFLPGMSAPCDFPSVICGFSGFWKLTISGFSGIFRRKCLYYLSPFRNFLEFWLNFAFNFQEFPESKQPRGGIPKVWKFLNGNFCPIWFSSLNFRKFGLNGSLSGHCVTHGRTRAQNPLLVLKFPYGKPPTLQASFLNCKTLERVEHYLQTSLSRQIISYEFS